MKTALAWFAFALLAIGTARADVDLQRIMADPDWIGPPVEAAWWQLEGSAFIYRVKRPDSQIRDLYRVHVDDGRIEQLEAADERTIDAADPVFDSDRSRALMIREGSLYVRDLGSGRLDHLHTGSEPVREALFSADRQHALFRGGNRWYRVALANGSAVPIADLRFEDGPHQPPDDELGSDQLRLFETLERERRRQLEAHREAASAAAADPTRRPIAWYLGDEMEASGKALSPDPRWMLVTVRSRDHDDGRSDRMPRFVTRSGYVEIE
ncbi:MAG: hypothetical protein ACNS61_07840, partial [Candidatus Wenzhouxiangella sp. M2_3B_020]